MDGPQALGGASELLRNFPRRHRRRAALAPKRRAGDGEAPEREELEAEAPEATDADDRSS